MNGIYNWPTPYNYLFIGAAIGGSLLAAYAISKGCDCAQQKKVTSVAKPKIAQSSPQRTTPVVSERQRCLDAIAAPHADLSKINLDPLLPQDFETLSHTLKYFNPRTIRENLTKIPRESIQYLSREQVKEFSVQQLCEIGNWHFHPDHLFDLDLTRFDDASINSFVGRGENRIHEFNPQTIGANIKRIDPMYYWRLTKNQCECIDINDIIRDGRPLVNGQCLMSMKNVTEQLKTTILVPFLPTKQQEEILEKYPEAPSEQFIKRLSDDDIQRLDIRKLSVRQLLAIGIDGFSKRQLNELDLAIFDDISINSFLNGNRVKELSPQTIGANIKRIDPKYYLGLSFQQCECIDFRFVLENKLFSANGSKLVSPFWYDQLAHMKNSRSYLHYVGETSQMRAVYELSLIYPWIRRDDDKFEEYTKCLQQAREVLSNSKIIEKSLKGVILASDDDPRKLFHEDFKSVTSENIEKLFRKKSLVFHPDRYSDPTEKKRHRPLCISFLLQRNLFNPIGK